jgi:transcriptional regulator with XRE-family HTH domain
MTGISKSTLSRLESGERRPSLELLLPVSQVYRLPLDDLVGAPEVGDPRVRIKPRQRNGRFVVPLNRQPGGLQAWKVIIPPARDHPEPRAHEGYEWLYVLAGQMRLILAHHDISMAPMRPQSSTPGYRTGSAPPAISPSRSSACWASKASASTSAPLRAAARHGMIGYRPCHDFDATCATRAASAGERRNDTFGMIEALIRTYAWWTMPPLREARREAARSSQERAGCLTTDAW